METFLKDYPSLLEVLQFVVQDNPEREKIVRELILMKYAQEVIEETLELRKRPGCENYGITQGLGHFRISREEAMRFIKSIGWGFSENVEVKEQKKALSFGNRFVKNGDRWLFSYDRKDGAINDLKGVGDIAYLLSKPFDRIEAVDLLGRLALPSFHSPLNEMSQEQLDKEGLSKVPLGRRTRVAFSSREEKGKMWRRLNEIDAEIERTERTGDFPLLNELKSQRDELMNDLSEKIKPTEGEEEARKAIERRIGTAIEKIRKQHPRLADHLSNSIRTGRTCSYMPDRSVHWEVRV